ncbi:MAG TPA: hypothetical protein VNW06_08055, partial [Cytophagaceae bacterium]|nr:hypothetical protein [Cytophagaceae bacterium]
MKSLILVSLFFYLFCLSGAIAQTIIYVDINATGVNNGSSWANAFPDVNSAILAASPNDEIWVAKGVYLTTSDNDPTKCFVITKNIRIYGGFNGTETTFSQRNVQSYETTLSGDIGVTGDSTDNSNYIFQILNQPGTVVIDGFTISQVYSLTTLGSAVSVNNCNDVRINHCYFNGNFSNQGAAAIDAIRLSKIQINSCKFTNNNSSAGAILAKDTCEISIDSSYFDNNFAPSDGGSISSTVSKLTITNTSFDYTAPITLNSQSIIYAWTSTYYDTTYYFNNCSFSGVTSSGSGLLSFNNVKKVIIQNSRFNNNKLLNGIPNILNFYGEEIEFHKCSFQNNQANGSDLLSLQ